MNKSTPLPPEPFFKEIACAVYDVFINRATWMVMVVSILLVVLFPAAVNQHLTKWDDRDPDPFVEFVSDGASFVLGGRIYMTNYPGTPVHEFYGWTTTLFRWILFFDESLPLAESQKAMREWMRLHPQTYFFILGFSGLLAYGALLLVLMGYSQTLFGDRWLGLFAAFTMASSSLFPTALKAYWVENYFLFAIVLAQASMLRFFEQSENPSPAWRALVTALFWYTLLISFKITTLPILCVFLFYVLMFKDQTSGGLSKNLQYRIAQIAFAVIPMTVALFFTAILIFKRSKLPTVGMHKVVVLIGAFLVAVAAFGIIKRYRTAVTHRVYLGVSIIGITLFFLIINAPMSWGAWVGFFVYDPVSLGFGWERLAGNWAMLHESHLRVWGFWVGVVAWGLHVVYHHQLKNHFGRIVVVVAPVMAIPFCLLWFSLYTPHTNYMLVLDTLSILTFFSLLGWVIHQHPTRGTSRYGRAVWTLGATSLIYPLLWGEVIFTPRVIFQKARVSLVTLEKAFPQYFEQGQDPNHFYSKSAHHFLEFANKYSDFRFPTELAATDRQQLQKTFDQAHPDLR